MIRISRRMGATPGQKGDKYINTPIELVDLAGGYHSVILSRRCLFLSIKPWSWHVNMETYSSTLGRELAITLQKKVLRKVSETWLIVISREKHWVLLIWTRISTREQWYKCQFQLSVIDNKRTHAGNALEVPMKWTLGKIKLK